MAGTKGPGMASTGPETRAGGGVAHLELLLEQQQGLFTRLDDLSRRQAGLIESDQTDRLLELLAERQVLVDQIATVNASLEPWRARWSTFINELDAGIRERVRLRVEAVSALAQCVAERDEHDRRLLEGRKEAVSVELGHVSRGRGAIAAYGTGSPREAMPRFQDREA